MPSSNPRYADTRKRKEIRQWLLVTQDHCALCGEPIDINIKTPHPLSPEVDEIIPISKGGSPIDKSNVQLTHRICNQRKGNRIQPKQPRHQPIRHSREW